MANTYSQQFVHGVFAVKHRKSVLKASIRPTAFAILGQQIKDAGCKSLIVNGIEDHVHCLFNIPPKYSTSEIMQKVKAKSSKDFNDLNLFESKFNWQTGFGAFTLSFKELDRVYKYIENQEAHHKKESFRDEYLQILKENNLEYDPKYLFESLH